MKHTAAQTRTSQTHTSIMLWFEQLGTYTQENTYTSWQVLYQTTYQISEIRTHNPTYINIDWKEVQRAT